MRVSPTDYADATRIAERLVWLLYGGAGILVGVSTRRIELTGPRYILALIFALLVCNLVLFMFQRISLPKVELQLDAAVAARDGPAFERHIIRREMAKIIQPSGGIALTLGFLAEIAVSHLWK
jgi:hypothetical protein